MSKIILLILGLSIIFLILLLVVTNRGGKLTGKNPVLFFNPNPSASTQRELPSTPLSIVFVSPENGAINVPADQPIQIVFSRPLDMDEIYISFGPGVVFKTAVNGNTVSAVPQSPFVAGLTYKLLVKFNRTGQLSNQYQFTVTGTPPATLPDTQPPGAAEQAEEFNRQNHPDLFLVNKGEIKQPSFELHKNMLKTAPNEHYSFILVTKKDSSKDDLSYYLKSLGLSQEQINSLDIVSITSEQFNKVGSFKNTLPFDDYDLSIGYDASFDKTSIYIDQKNKTNGEQRLNDYLKQNSIGSVDWINNLSIIYQ